MKIGIYLMVLHVALQRIALQGGSSPFFFSLHKCQRTDLGPGCQLHSLTGLPHFTKLCLIRTKVNFVKSKLLMMRHQKDTHSYICN